MGAADVVPGVSGGTIAFITGIYETLINAIHAFDKQAITLLFKGRIKQLWEHVNGSFLVTLLAGILASVATLSRLLVYLLEHHTSLLWSFFFGLIVASALVILPKVKKWSVAPVIALIVGIAVAWYISTASQSQTPEGLWFVFLSGAIAICAMILPGISGSFILLLLGKYDYILSAVKDMKADVIITFALGCVVGILSFARLLKWLLKHYYDAFVALLTGFMIGALNKVWPWKHTLETYTDRHGEVKPLVQENVLPSNYEVLTGQSAQWIACVALAVAGFLVIFLTSKFAGKEEEKA